MMRRCARILIVALTLIALLPAGCSKIQTSTGLTGSGNPWTVHGILRVGSYEDLDSLNPIVSTQAFVTDVDQMIFSGLIDYDDQGNPVPDVAIEVPTSGNGGISRDGKTITYHLRQGVKFSDGVQLTSADVKYTWQQILNPSNNVGYRYPYNQVVSVDTPDDYTVIVRLKAPLASFVAAFMRNGIIGSIIPKHLLSGYADLNRVPFNTHPVGSGPFYVERWEPGALLTLRANASYWRGPPKLKEIQYRIITSQNTMLTDVLSHNVDLYYDAPEVQYATLKSLRGYRVTAVPNMTYEHVEFNCARPPLDDVRVRKALAYAINWRKIATYVYLGLGTPGMADTPPMSWAYDPSVEPYPYDPVRARRLLKEAGWRPDSTGIMRKNGEPLHIDISTVAGMTSRAKTEELIQQDLAAIGIALDIRNYQANLLFATYGYGGILARGNFNLAIYAWEYTFPDPDDTNTRGPDELPPIGENYSRCRDWDIGAWQRAAEAHYDRAQRRPYYVLIQRRFYETVPFHTIVWRANIDVVNTDLRNFKPAPDVSDFWNSWEWKI